MGGGGPRGAPEVAPRGVGPHEGLHVAPLRLRSHRRGVREEAWTDMPEGEPETREERKVRARGHAIFAAGGVERAPELDTFSPDGRPLWAYRVTEQPGRPPHITYVGTTDRKFRCDCELFGAFHHPCHHIFAVWECREAERGFQPQPVEPPVEVRRRRDTHLYKLSRRFECPLFHLLARELGKMELDPFPPQATGRPRTPFAVHLYCALVKVRSTFAEERIQGDDYQLGRCWGLLSDKPSGAPAVGMNAVSSFLNWEGLTPILSDMIAATALPFRHLMRSIAPDSTGLKIDQYNEWQVERWSQDPDKAGQEKAPKKEKVRMHGYVKLHMSVDTETGLVVGAEVSKSRYDDDERDEDSKPLPGVHPIHDSPNFRIMLERTVDGGIRGLDYVADKAYISRENFTRVAQQGGRMFCPPRKGDRPNKGGSAAWAVMMKWFWDDFWTWKENYNDRTAVERAFAALKKVLSDDLLSKSPTARVNEALLMVLAYNLRVIARMVVYDPRLLQRMARVWRQEYGHSDDGWGVGSPPSPFPALPPGPGDDRGDTVLLPEAPLERAGVAEAPLHENSAPLTETAPWG